MISAVCGGPIIETYSGGTASWVPAWWVNSDTWGRAALQAEVQLRSVNLERVALALADSGTMPRTAGLWVVSGAVAKSLRGLRGFKVQEGIGGWFDVALDDNGKVRDDAPEDLTLLHVGWTQVILVQVQGAKIGQAAALAEVPGWQEIAKGLLKRALNTHAIRWDLLEAGWRGHSEELPFHLQDEDLAALHQRIETHQPTHLAGLGQAAWRVLYGNGLPWVSEARGLAKFAAFLDQRA